MFTDDVPIPPTKLLPFMKAGQSAVFPAEAADRIRVFLWRYKKKNPSTKWAIRTEGEQIRVWRVE